jgi:hypothetical protein
VRNLNQPASAFPVACNWVSERNKIGRIPYWEDSPQLAAGYSSIIIILHTLHNEINKE